MKKQAHLLIALLFLSSLLVPAIFPNTVRAYTYNDTIISPLHTQSHIQLLWSNTNGMRFNLITPAVTVTADGQPSVDGLTAYTQESGAPSLPYYSTYIALPPEANVTVEVTPKVSSSQSVPTLRPAAAAATNPLTDETRSNTTPHSTNSGPQAIYEPDPTYYGRNAAYPHTTYTLSEPMYYRDLRVVELRLYPLTYNPVTHHLQQAQTVEVSLAFTGQQLTDLRPLSGQMAYRAPLAGMVLNYQQAQNWHSLPSHLRQLPNTELPIGVDSYKIEVQQDGIYEISYADLVTAGMDVDNIDPTTFALLYQGEPVAYQFIGNSDTTFTADEKVRFYGWAFDGPRAEKQFITNNVFWLVYDSTPTSINNIASSDGYSPTHTFTSSVTAETDQYYFGTWSDDEQWAEFPNEPDAWYWHLIFKRLETVLTKTYAIALPHPVLDGGTNAQTVVELTSRTPANAIHTLHTTINAYDKISERSWFGVANVNIEQTVPISALVNNNNFVKVVSTTPTNSTNLQYVYLNRITIDYQRYLNAIDDQLIFTDQSGGQREFHIAKFNETNVNNVLFWNITDPMTPVQIDLTATNIISGNPTVTYTAGSDHAAQAEFIITTQDNILSTSNSEMRVSQYTAPDLTPTSNGADWVVITHQDFIEQAQRLADHRANPLYGELATHVVDVEDVINQYGYGLPLPQAIRDYYTYALSNWTPAPSYLLLLGDATQNPRHLDCLGFCSIWDENEPTYVITDLVFQDRFQGLIPSDHTYTMLIGDDILPDIAVGRIAAQTNDAATRVVSKIIQFEQNQLNDDSNNNWNQSVVFIGDNPDSGGFFCNENEAAATHLDPSLQQSHFCISDEYNEDPVLTEKETQLFRETVGDYLNNSSVSLVNYRGHGSIDNWANENIVSTDTAILDTIWQNDEPVMIISADCLDNYFAWPGRPSLGETIMELNGTGSAAHWSSTGLGFSFEHSVLQTAFYDAVFIHKLSNIGDAINYAKAIYIPDYHDSEAFAFTLQGDPAMQIFHPQEEPFQIYIPLIQKQ